MRLTSLDIHQKEFGHKLKGYNEEEVDKFLDQVADEIDRLRKENIDISERLEAADERVRQYQEMERTLHNTLLAAQRSSEDILDKARGEAQAILRDAEVKAKEIIHAALSQKQRVQGDFMRLKEAEQEFRVKFRDLLEGYVSRLVEVPLPEDIRGVLQERAEEPVDLGFADAAGLTSAEPSFIGEPAYEPAAEIAEEPLPAEEWVPAEEPQASQGAFVESEEELEAPATGLYDAESDEGSEDLLFVPAEPEPAVEEPAPEEPGQAPPSYDEPPASGFVTSLTLGEVGSGPDLASETADFGEPSDFGSVLGEREDDVDIEEID